MCMVISVDLEAGTGEVSSRVDGERHIESMALADISDRLANTAKLDNVRGPAAMHRIFCVSNLDEELDDETQVEKWYFNTREGRKGSFESEQAASAALAQYIMDSQSCDPKDSAAA